MVNKRKKEALTQELKDRWDGKILQDFIDNHTIEGKWFKIYEEHKKNPKI